tara:strand:+ start:4578 stop:4784 length:207 start_codon:yes stop_codon:yes gene_type:complete
MSKSLSVYLIESGETGTGKQTERVDIITPRDSSGDEMIISVEAGEVVISKLVNSTVVEKKKILLSELS